MTETHLIIGGDNKEIRLYDLEKYSCKDADILKGHADEVRSITVNLKYRQLLSGSNDNTIILWDLETKIQLKRINVKENVYSVVFSGDFTKIIYRTSTKVVVIDKNHDENNNLWEYKIQNDFRDQLLVHPESNSLIFYDYGIDGKGNYFGRLVQINLHSFKPTEFRDDEPEEFQGDFELAAFEISKTSETQLFFSIKNNIFIWDIVKNQKEAFINPEDTNIISLIATDFQTLIIGDDKETIKIWNLQTKAIELVIKDSKYDIEIAKTKENLHIYIGTKDFKICKWSLFENKQEGKFLEGHKQQITCLKEFQIKSGKMALASAAKDLILIIWNTETEQILLQFADHKLPINNIIYSDKNPENLLTSCDNDVEIITWDIDKKKQVKKLESDSILYVSSDFYMKRQNKFLELINFQNEVVGRLKIPARFIQKIKIDLKFKKIYAYLRNITICIWNLAKSQKLDHFKGAKHFFDLKILNNSTVVSVSDNLEIWDLKSKQLVRTIEISAEKIIKMSKDLTKFLELDYMICFTCFEYKLNTTKKISKFQIPNEMIICETNSDLSLISFYDSEHRLSTVNVLSGEILKTSDKTKNEIIALSISEDNKVLIAGSEDSSIELWSIDQLQITDVLMGHSDKVHLLSFVSPNIIVSGSFDKTIRIWNLADKTKKTVIPTGQEKLLAIQANLNTCEIASVGEDGSVKYWNFQGDPVKHEFKIDFKDKSNPSLVISLDLNYFVIANNDNDFSSLIFWDRATMEQNDQTKFIRKIDIWLCFSTHEKFIIITENNELAAWDIKTNTFLYSKQIGYEFSQCYFRFEATRLYFAKNDGVIDIWDLNEGKCSTLIHPKDLNQMELSDPVEYSNKKKEELIVEEMTYFYFLPMRKEICFSFNGTSKKKVQSQNF